MSGEADERRRSIGEVKAHFAECVRTAEAGVGIVLTRHGRPVARLEPYTSSSRATQQVGEVHESPSTYRLAGSARTEEVEFRSPARRREALRRLLESEIWPRVPTHLLGKGASKVEREEILGYGEDGV